MKNLQRSEHSLSRLMASSLDFALAATRLRRALVLQSSPVLQREPVRRLLVNCNIVQTLQSYISTSKYCFDNVMTKLMINNRTGSSRNLLATLRDESKERDEACTYLEGSKINLVPRVSHLTAPWSERGQ